MREKRVPLEQILSEQRRHLQCSSTASASLDDAVTAVEEVATASPVFRGFLGPSGTALRTASPDSLPDLATFSNTQSSLFVLAHMNLRQGTLRPNAAVAVLAIIPAELPSGAVK